MQVLGSITILRPSAWRAHLGPIGGLAGLYCLGAWAGSLLAVPPGFISAFWIPAGLALVMVLVWGPRVAPGVLIGSFLVTFAMGVKVCGLHGPFLPVAALALGIALGATLQALTGGYLIRRYVNYPGTRKETPNLLGLMALGGPLACLISPTLGVLLLALKGDIPLTSVPFAWFSWYVGDTIGVLIVVPLFLILFGEPAERWRGHRLRVGLPMLVAMAIVVGTFLLVGHQEELRIREVFERKTAEVTHRLQTTLDEHLTILALTRDYFKASPTVDRQGFALFTRDVLAQNRTLQALEWVPRIAAKDRSAFEADVRREAPDRAFTIRERDPRSGMVPAGPREAYFPVCFLEPFAGNEKAFGFDLGSEPRRKEGMERALRSGKAAATEAVLLAQEQAHQAGVLVFLPVFRPGESLGTPEERGRALAGFALGVVRIGDLVEKSLANLDLSQVHFRLAEEDGRSTVLFTHPLAKREAPASAVASFRSRAPLRLADRVWLVTYEPTLGFLDANRSPVPWVVEAVGMLLTGLLGVFLLEMSLHRDLLAAREAQRAKAEAEAKAEKALRTSEAERAALEQKLLQVQKMESLGVLAGGVAHEMNNILAAILGLSSAHLTLHPPDSPAFRAFDIITTAATRGAKIVKNLMGFARQHPMEAQILDVNLLLRREAHLLERALPARISLRLELAEDLRSFHGDESALTHALKNLFKNALDAMPEGGTLTVRSRNGEEGWLDLGVEDTGCGMSPEVLLKATEPFFTTKEVGQGTGLGLSMVYSTVKAFHGHLEVRSQPGLGTQVTLRLPALGAEAQEAGEPRLATAKDPTCPL